MNLKKIIILCVSILLVGAIINIGFDIRGLFQADAAKVSTIADTYENVEVVSDNASITVLPTTNSNTKVEYTGNTKQKKKYKFSAKVKGDTLYVELLEKRWNTFQFGINSGSTKLTIYLPEKVYDDINVSTSNGSIKANDIQGDQLIFESNNGSVLLEDIVGKNVHAETDNGKVALKNIAGTIVADSDNGAISLDTKNLDQHINLSTDNGAIEIKTENEPTNATIQAKNDLGGIDLFGSSDSSITYGKGKYLIELNTDLGRISVRK